MGAPVRVDDKAFSDERYGDLAEYAQLTDADHARGKMLLLWRQCTLQQRHALSAATVCRILGTNGVDALVRSRLGERVDGDLVRIHGTHGRIEWLQKLRGNGEFGKLGGRPVKPSRVSDADLAESEKEPSRVSERNQLETPLTLTPILTPTKKMSGKPDAIALATPDVVALAEIAVAEINRLGRTNYKPTSIATLQQCQILNKLGYTSEQIRAVVCSRKHWISDDKMREYLRPSTLLRLSNFKVYLEDLEAKKPVNREATPDEPPELSHLVVQI